MTPVRIPVHFGIPVTIGESYGPQIGGLPQGLAQKDWPKSPEGEHLHFLAQIPLAQMSDRFKLAYAFMAQTYDPESNDCINETFDASKRLTAVILIESPGENRALGPSIGEPEYFDLEESWHFYFDSGDEMPDDWIPLLDEEPGISPFRIGGPVRWWQSGSNHPNDANDMPMKLAAQIDFEAHSGLENYIAAGVCHVFYSEETGEGAIVWEVD